MARRNRDDDLLMDEDELTAAFLGDDEVNQPAGPAEPAGPAAPADDEWDESDDLPGQLAVDVYETREKLVVKARTAGVNKHDLDVSISDNTLSIRGTLSAGNTTERELFISNRERIIGPKSTHIKPHVLAVLRKLTGLISITRETTGEVFLLEGRPNITIHADAPANIAELHGFRPLFPPGTEIEKMKLSAYQHISAEALAHAKQLLEHQLGYKESLTHRQALTLLDLITDAEIKRALRQEIRRQDHSISSARALEMLRSQVKRSLDEGFYDAWRARMIGGNSATGSEGHVRLIGGMLPIITNPARFVTKRWNVGPVFKS